MIQIKIKNLYISYDSGKLTSTLINLDIEEWFEVDDDDISDELLFAILDDYMM